MNLTRLATPIILIPALAGCVNHEIVYPSDAVEREEVMVQPAKDPGVAAAMSTVVPGLGEMYAGNLFNGTVTLMRQGLLLGIMAGSGASGSSGALVALGSAVAYLAGWAWSLNSAYGAADHFNHHLATLRVLVITEKAMASGSARVR